MKVIEGRIIILSEREFTAILNAIPFKKMVKLFAPDEETKKLWENQGVKHKQDIICHIVSLAKKDTSQRNFEVWE